MCANNELKTVGKEVTVASYLFGRRGSHKQRAAVHYRRNVNDDSQSSGWYSNTRATVYEAVVPTIMLRRLLITLQKQICIKRS
jgi:hypothetical protein